MHSFNSHDVRGSIYYTCEECYLAWETQLNEMFAQYEAFLPILCDCGWPIADVSDMILEARVYNRR